MKITKEYLLQANNSLSDSLDKFQKQNESLKIQIAQLNRKIDIILVQWVISENTTEYWQFRAEKAEKDLISLKLEHNLYKIT